MNKVTAADLTYVYASVVVRLALALAIGGCLLVGATYAYSGYRQVARVHHDHRNEYAEIYHAFCTAPDAPDDRRFTPVCLTARDLLKTDNLRHQIVVQWMQDHLAHLPGFGWCLGFPSCFHAASHAVANLFSLWFILKLAGIAFLVITIANTVLFVTRHAYPLTKEFRSQQFVPVASSSS
jgi:hypothetical protein